MVLLPLLVGFLSISDHDECIFHIIYTYIVNTDYFLHIIFYFVYYCKKFDSCPKLVLSATPV
jgi:hypothetical protein